MHRYRLKRSWRRPAVLVVAGMTFAVAFVGQGNARTETARSSARPVPVLMYHELRDPPHGVRYPDLYVRPDDFRRQLDWLERRGYHAVTLRAVWEHWHYGKRLPAKPIVISIDDGFRSTARVALPALRSRGWPAVLNLALHHLDVRWGLWSRDVRSHHRSGLGARRTHPHAPEPDRSR